MKALRTQPPDALSAMDGYAVRAADVAQAPATLHVIGEVAAGHPFEGEVKAGQAARIFTGGVMPAGADTVVIQELTAREGDTRHHPKADRQGPQCARPGIDFSEGQVLLRQGTPSDRPRSDAGRRHEPSGLPVHRRPKVAVLGTGDELVRARRHARSRARSSIPTALRSSPWREREGAEVTDLGIARDSIEDIAAAVRRARDGGADILVTSGGASVGEHDLVQRALAAEGLDLSFWRVALRPGRPMMHGRLGAMQVLGVPGNPVSSYVCAFLFLVPLIRPPDRPQRREPRARSPPGSAAICRPMTSAPTTCGPPSRTRRRACWRPRCRPRTVP